MRRRMWEAKANAKATVLKGVEETKERGQTEGRSAGALLIPAPALGT
jgi:hypothetical protein